MELAIYTAGALIVILVIFFGIVWITTYHPDDLQDEPVISPEYAPMIKPGQKLKVLSWNIQYMAGKNYIFWYDLLDASGLDTRPSSDEIAITLREVARVIMDEDPDIILLQEVDDGARRTDYEDQLANLLTLLPKAYCCHASAFYWKASFVPHPKIMGAVGMKLSTISKYKICQAKRHQLAHIPRDPLTQQFHLKRAILETRFPLTDGNQLVALNTHLDPFARGTNTMQKQVKQIVSLLKNLSQEELAWVIGGDFNLLPSGSAYNRLMESEKKYYNANTEIAPIFELYRGIPGLEEDNGPDHKKWFTHFPNRASIKSPDRTIDYIFISNDIQLGTRHVRQNDTLKISDHFPVVVEIKIP